MPKNALFLLKNCKNRRARYLCLIVVTASQNVVESENQCDGLDNFEDAW